MDDDTIFLAKENGQVSEQTFYARVTTSSSSAAAVSAILNVDYSLTEFELDSATVLIPPHLDRVPVLLNLLAPSREEDAVEFQLVVGQVAPHILSPSLLFQNINVKIEGIFISV